MIDSNYKNPKVAVVPNPVNLDLAILNIQNSIANLSWLQKIFGRAKILPVKDIDGKQKLEPMVFQGNAEYFSVLPNDSFNSYCFFRTNGIRDTEDDFFHTTNTDVIFWVNLNAIDGSKNFIFTEELIKDAFEVLKELPGVDVLRIIDEKAEEIFKGYSLNTEQRGLLYYPFDAFKFELRLTYENLC